MKYFAYTIITVVTISLIAGFFIVGSPQEERLRRFDERRANDLQQLQSGVINHFLAKDALPKNFAELAASTAIPADPENGMPYEYSVKNKNTFALCATFALPSIPYQGGAPMIGKPFPAGASETNWDHEVGRMCFEKQIDKDFYPPPQKLR